MEIKRQYITILPNNNYSDLLSIKANELPKGEIIQYGYIKLRDLDKWNNNEIVSVKMGQLFPHNNCYWGLSVLEAACKRIAGQDTTALFDDEDELVPVYVFVANITDNKWREYLLNKGYKASRTSAPREGIRICKADVYGEYGIRFNIDPDKGTDIGKEIERVQIEEQEQERKENSRFFWCVFTYIAMVILFFVMGCSNEELQGFAIFGACMIIPPVCCVPMYIWLIIWSPEKIEFIK